MGNQEPPGRTHESITSYLESLLAGSRTKEGYSGFYVDESLRLDGAYKIKRMLVLPLYTPAFNA